MGLNVHVMEPLRKYQSTGTGRRMPLISSIVGARCRGTEICVLRVGFKSLCDRKRLQRGWGEMKRNKKRDARADEKEMEESPAKCFVFTDHWWSNGSLKWLLAYSCSHPNYLLSLRCLFFLIQHNGYSVVMQLLQSASRTRLMWRYSLATELRLVS